MYEITIKDFEEDLAQLVKQEALELHSHTTEHGDLRYFIPYMMNDAVECYYILEQCRTTGTDLKDFRGSLQAQLTHPDGQHALIIRQGDSHVFTIWFNGIQKNLQCYRYHEIGHFWVKGQEQWRQLVYIIGTIYDKYEYMGEAICTKKELALLPLMEFAPFRYWSPVHESILDDYPDTMDGLLLMQEFAAKANDRKLLFLLKLYASHPNHLLMQFLCNHLSSYKGQAVYQLIWDKVADASGEYPSRDYGTDKNQQIQRERQSVTLNLKRQGFSGAYPHFWKGTTQIIIAEEHPFTILDWEDFSFQVQYMVSEYKGNHCTRNAGFFRGRGRKGWIETTRK